MASENNHFADFSRIVMIAVMGWVGLSVAHLPAIEERLDLYIKQVDAKLLTYDERLRKLEPGR